MKPTDEYIGPAHAAKLLNIVERSVRRLAEQEGWEYRAVKRGRSTGYEYLRSSIEFYHPELITPPKSTAVTATEKQLTVAKKPEPSKWESSPKWARDKAHERLSLVQQVRHIKKYAPRNERAKLIARAAKENSGRTVSRWLSAADSARKAEIRA